MKTSVNVIPDTGLRLRDHRSKYLISSKESSSKGVVIKTRQFQFSYTFICITIKILRAKEGMVNERCTEKEFLSRHTGKVDLKE